MNAILGYSELILEDARCGPDGRRGIARIRGTGQRLLGLINEVLHLARIDATSSFGLVANEVEGLVERFVAAGGGVLTEAVDVAEPARRRLVMVDAGRLAYVVSEVVDGFLRVGCHEVALHIRQAERHVVMSFVPSVGRTMEADVPLCWLIAERSAQPMGVRLLRLADGTIEIHLPERDRFHDLRQRIDTILMGPTPLPGDPFEAMRIRLSVGLVAVSLLIVCLTGPPTVLLSGSPASTGAVQLGVWFVFLVAVFAIFRRGWFGLGRVVMAAGLLLILTQGLFQDGGPAAAALPTFALLVVIGTLLLGSAGGYVVTAGAMSAVAFLGLAHVQGWLPDTEPISRAEAAFTTFVMTVQSGVLVGVGSLPLMGIVQRSSEAATRAREADESTNRFLDVVSLELRAPLQAILHDVELLRERSDDLHIASDLQKIFDASRHLLILVDDLLDMSAIAEDQLDVELLDVAVQPLLESVVGIAGPLADQNGNTVSLLVDDDATKVLADPHRLRQVLTNLLSNAAKFTRGGRIYVRAVRESPARIALSVADSGIGIDADDLVEL
ncbi:MAG: histidine kinase dimerization/phospho-acceptor domain-containing protein, partial [Myxococcota bacterium]